MALELELPGVYLDAIVVEASAPRPTVVNRDPEPDEGQVPRDAVIQFDLVDVGPDGIDVAATRVFVAGELAFDAGVFAPRYDNARSGARTPAPDTLRLLLASTSPFSSLQQVAVRVVTRTARSGLGLDLTWSFTCEDVTGPRLLAAQARASTRVRLSFDEAVLQRDPRAPGDAWNPTSYTLTRRSAPAVDAAIVAVEPVTSSSVDLITDVALTPAATYEVTVLEVVDRFGNPIVAPDHIASFTGFAPPRPRSRSFDLYGFLAQVNRSEDETGDLARFLSCLQEVTDLLLADIDRFADLFDPDLAPEPVLDLMLGEIGNPFLFELSVVDKRRLLQVLVAMHREKGTAVGITNAIRFFLGIEAVFTAYAGEALVLGESRLGEDWILGPSGAFAAFAFELVVPRALSADERQRLRQIVDYLRPAHTHFVRLVEPTIPEDIDHLELGRSELGDTWMLH